MEIVLASSSPRRRELLRAAGVPHRVVPPRSDETAPPGLAPTEVAALLAERKARSVLGEAEGRPVLAADTIVVLDGEILGKPGTAARARETLGRLSGREHEVLTAVCLFLPASGAIRTRVVSSRVKFRELDPEAVARYVRGGEPLDKAGAYGIQGEAAAFVEELTGSRDNVIGLPVAEVLEMLAEAE